MLYIFVNQQRVKRQTNQSVQENKLLPQLIQVKEQEDEYEIDDQYNDDSSVNNSSGLFTGNKIKLISESKYQDTYQSIQEEQSIKFDQLIAQDKNESSAQNPHNDCNQISQLHSDSSIHTADNEYTIYENTRCERVLMYVETLFDIQSPKIKDLLLQDLYNISAKINDKLLQYKLINCMALCLDRSDAWLQQYFGLQTMQDVHDFANYLYRNLFWSQCNYVQDMKAKTFIGMCNQFMFVDNYLSTNELTEDYYQWLFNDFEKKILVNPNFNLQEHKVLARQTSSQSIQVVTDVDHLQKYLEYDLLIEVKTDEVLKIKEIARSLCCYSKFCNYNANIQLVNCSQLTNLSLTNTSWPKILGPLNIQYLALSKVNNVNYDELSTFLKIKHFCARKIMFNQQTEQETGRLLIQAVKKYYQIESLTISSCVMPKTCVINFPMKYLRILVIEYMQQLTDERDMTNNFIIDSNTAQLVELEMLCLRSQSHNINLQIKGNFKLEQLYFISVSSRGVESDKQ